MAVLEPVPAKVRSIWPPLVLLVASLGYVCWAQEFREIPRMMPTIVGLATAVMAALDLLSRLNNRVAAWLRVTLGADFMNPEIKHNPSLRRESMVFTAMVGFVLTIVIVGILPAVPFFIMMYMRFWGYRSWSISLISAVAILVFVVAVFELALDYELFRGVLFDPRGFDSW